MATPVSNSVALTGNPFIDGLLEGGSWQFGDGPHVLTYSFSLDNVNSGGPWTPSLSGAFNQALSAWSNVANITFVEQGSGGVFTQSSADIAATLTGNELGWFYDSSLGIPPDPGFATQLELAAIHRMMPGNYVYRPPDGTERLIYPHPEGDVFFDNFSAEYTDVGPGGLGLMRMLYEVGDALGLWSTAADVFNAHPTFSDLGIFAYQSYLGTVMNTPFELDSYSSGGAPATPMPLDILAIQYIYGANMSYQTGNDTYPLLPYANTIWDAGGIDAIDASNLSNNVTVNLRQGMFSNSFANSNSATAIAYGVTIENAIGGSGNDTIYGNDAANAINGGPGQDIMQGGNGDDIYVVDNTGDSVVENLNEGTDSIQSSVSYTLPAHVENLMLTGGNANLTGTGNELDNIIASNTGVDTLAGGLGNDTYYLNNAADVVIENPGEGADTVVAGFSYSLVGTNLENVTLTGSAGLSATGNASDNVLVSNTGVDTLTGGFGNDAYVLNNAADTIIENPGEGTDTVATSFNYSLAVGSNLENVTLFGSDAVNATGDALDNVITGNSAPNVLTGGLGNDTLIGGFALDTVRFSGLMSSYTIAHSGTSGTVSGPDGTDTFSSVERLQFDDQSLSFVVPKGDFNGDGQSDILWHNTNGQLLLWQMNGAALIGAEAVADGTAVSADWKIAGVEDFNGDGKSDLLWRNSDGAVAEWNMNGTAIDSVGTVAGGAGVPADWQIAGIGDFGGDGNADILWQNTSGQLALWQMDGANLINGGAVAGGAAVSADWHIAAVQDFNGDVKNDILWRNDSGAVAEWNMNDTAIASVGTVAGGAGVPADWMLT